MLYGDLMQNHVLQTDDDVREGQTGCFAEIRGP